MNPKVELLGGGGGGGQELTGKEWEYWVRDRGLSGG